MELFKYRFDKITSGDGPFKETVDYLLTVPCENREDSLIFIFRSYCFQSFLYITDIFPQMYENDSRRFKRFTSHEGYTVNMRRLSVTCLAIFVDCFIKSDVRKAMVISGSYQDGEQPSGPSRKLKLYLYFFYPILEQFNLRSVEMLDQNAFILVSKDSPVKDGEIKQSYLDFKTFIK